jgi:hypothetical protein
VTRVVVLPKRRVETTRNASATIASSSSERVKRNPAVQRDCFSERTAQAIRPGPDYDLEHTKQHQGTDVFRLAMLLKEFYEVQIKRSTRLVSTHRPQWKLAKLSSSRPIRSILFREL